MNYNLTVSTYEQDTLLFTEQTICTIENNILTYSNDTDMLTINLNKFNLIRKNSESTLKITDNLCTLKINELNKTIEIPLDYLNYNFEHNKNITIIYKLASQDVPLKIILQIGDEIKNV